MGELLADQIADARAQWLVLDDLHELDDAPGLAEILGFLEDRLTIRLLVTARTRPHWVAPDEPFMARSARFLEKSWPWTKTSPGSSSVADPRFCPWRHAPRAGQPLSHSRLERRRGAFLLTSCPRRSTTTSPKRRSVAFRQLSKKDSSISPSTPNYAKTMAMAKVQACSSKSATSAFFQPRTRPSFTR